MYIGECISVTFLDFSKSPMFQDFLQKENAKITENYHETLVAKLRTERKGENAISDRL